MFDSLVITVNRSSCATNLVIRNERKRQCNQDNRGIISS